MREPLDALFKILTLVNLEGEEAYKIEYDKNSWMNILTDRENRDVSCIQIEEVETGSYSYEARRGVRKSAAFSVYFFKFCNFHNRASYGDTVHSEETREASHTRQEIRNEIEEEIVKPFIATLMRGGSWFFPVPTIGFTYPTSRYDANECGILLTFNLEIRYCQDVEGLFNKSN